MKDRQHGRASALAAGRLPAKRTGWQTGGRCAAVVPLDDTTCSCRLVLTDALRQGSRPRAIGRVREIAREIAPMDFTQAAALATASDIICEGRARVDVKPSKSDGGEQCWLA